MLPAIILAAMLHNPQPDAIRPVDPEYRASEGFAAPREPKAILADIESLPPEDTSRPEAEEGWSALRAHNDALFRMRANLVSELEEAGYKGDRLRELLWTKLGDAARLAQTGYGPMNRALALLWEEQEIHRDEPLGAVAHLYSISLTLTVMNHNHLLVAERDLQTIADLELAAAKDPQQKGVGSTLLRALSGQEAATREKWFAWAQEHLPADSTMARTAIRERSFDHPIQLEGPTLDGQRIDTADMRGKVILVDFWGTWCGPCKERMPGIERLRTKYEARGLRVVGVLYDQPEPAKKYLAQQKYSWPQIIDPANEGRTFNTLSHPITERYAINAFPTIWLIDRGGVLRRASSDETALEVRIVELLDQPVPVAPSGSK
jgi:thiol-disulfide isomerase/thioredoxin